ncbi:hypothetical protein [Rugamonas sp.]|uniref:hypothetical protein n=1 Tax=Rugamonas sp. TaxID=1926287 RepID=UPI0025F10324|nr:hypothetical protein [Rugamonas sp.]
MKPSLSLLALSLAAIALDSAAQEAAVPAAPRTTDAADAAEAAPVVEVSSVKNPQLKPYRQMLKGLDAYAAHRALAPAAPLRFTLVADDSKLSLDNVALRIAGDNTSIPIPVAKDGSFVLDKIQSAADDNADIVSNKKKGLLHWHADIHTPDVPADARRLGDLRLECEISWAVTKDDMSFFIRNGIMLAGGLCHSSHIMLHYGAPRALAAVTLVSGARREALTIDKKDRRVFMPPLSDASWNDETLIEYQFADAGPAS